MQDRTLDRLFERYRRRGDVAALGQVFDRASGELLRVAMFLARDGAEAEDLLQSTFLCAIERAGRYDGSRSLVAWLVGILVNEARVERRRSRRAVDPGRLAEREAERPDDAAEGHELTDEVGRALASLSARDRELLEATLRQGVAPIDYARQRGLAPGTVRMQLHRGIERLRRALPAGLALGGAAILSGGRGTAQVRARVLEAARRAAAPLAPHPSGSGAGSALTLGGSIVTKNVTLTAVALALVAGLYWMVGQSAGASRAGVGGGVDAAPAAVASGGRDLVGAPVATVPDTSVAEAIRRPASGVTTPEESWSAALSGITGRLVEPDGTPAAGQELVLLELDFDEVRSAVALVAADRPAPRLVVDQTVTDPDGRFALHGVRASTLHALAGTEHSPRVPLRMVAEPLVPGEARDLGDVVLPARGRLTGEVVDEGGRPVVGARVRVGPIPMPVLEAGAGGLRPDSLLFVGSGELHQLLTPPSWALRLEDHLGLAHATTDSAGRFVFEDLVLGAQSIVVDRPGFVATFREIAVDALDAEPRRLVLQRGRLIRGNVFSADGDPAVGAEVLVGVAPSVYPITVLQHAGRTDAEGRFELSGVADGPGIVVARRGRASPWTVVTGAEDEDELDVQLPEVGTLSLRILDRAGTPIPDPRVTLQPDPLAMGALRGLLPPLDVAARLRPTEDGVRITDLDHGTYGVLVAAEGHATSSLTVHLDRDLRTEQVVLVQVPALEVRVRDGSTGAAVPGARVALLMPRSGDGMVLDATVTDPDGHGGLRPGLVEGRLPDRLLLRVEHPAHATALQECPLEPGRPVEVVLGSGGTLEVLARPGESAEAFGLMLLSRMEEGDEDTQFLRLDQDGRARKTNLATGEWSYQLVPGWAPDASFLASVKSEDALDQRARGEFRIEEGRTTQVMLAGLTEVQADLGEIGATVEGRVRIGGVAAAGVSVSIQGPNTGQPIEVPLTSDGSFRFENVPSDVHVLVVNGQTFFGFVGLRDLVPGERRRVDIDWERQESIVEVLDPDGNPLEDALVQVRGAATGVEAMTSSGGRARVAFIGPGPHRVVVRHPQAGSAEQVVEQVTPELTVTVSSGLPCAGEVALRGAKDGPASLVIDAGDGMPWTANLEFAQGRAPFEVAGLEAGEYQVWLEAEGFVTRPRPLLLGPHGDRALVLEFEVQKR